MCCLQQHDEVASGLQRFVTLIHLLPFLTTPTPAKPHNTHPPHSYYFRVLERQQGSVKFGSYAATVTGMSFGLQVALGRLLQVEGPWSPGPLALVFASFVPFLLDIPATSDFTVLGYRLTDKVRCGWGGAGLVMGWECCWQC